MRLLLLSILIVVKGAQEGYSADSGRAAAYQIGAKTSIKNPKVSGDANRLRAQELLSSGDQAPAPIEQDAPPDYVRPVSAPAFSKGVGDKFLENGQNEVKSQHEMPNRPGQETSRIELENLPVEDVGSDYKVDSATSQLMKEVAYSKKPPVAPPRAQRKDSLVAVTTDIPCSVATELLLLQLPHVTVQPPLQYSATAINLSEKPLAKSEHEGQEDAKPLPPVAHSPAYTKSMTLDTLDTAEGEIEADITTTSPSVDTESRADLETSSKLAFPEEQAISEVEMPIVPVPPEGKEESYKPTHGSSYHENTPKPNHGAVATNDGPGDRRGEMEIGSAPAYPKSNSDIYAPSSSFADSVVSNISTTARPFGVYQHPEGKKFSVEEKESVESTANNTEDKQEDSEESNTKGASELEAGAGNGEGAVGEGSEAAEKYPQSGHGADGKETVELGQENPPNHGENPESLISGDGTNEAGHSDSAGETSSDDKNSEEDKYQKETDDKEVEDGNFDNRPQSKGFEVGEAGSEFSEERKDQEVTESSAQKFVKKTSTEESEGENPPKKETSNQYRKNENDEESISKPGAENVEGAYKKKSDDSALTEVGSNDQSDDKSSSGEYVGHEVEMEVESKKQKENESKYASDEEQISDESTAATTAGPPMKIVSPKGNKAVIAYSLNDPNKPSSIDKKDEFKHTDRNMKKANLHVMQSQSSNVESILTKPPRDVEENIDPTGDDVEELEEATFNSIASIGNTNEEEEISLESAEQREELPHLERAASDAPLLTSSKGYNHKKNHTGFPKPQKLRKKFDQVVNVVEKKAMSRLFERLKPQQIISDFPKTTQLNTTNSIKSPKKDKNVGKSSSLNFLTSTNTTGLSDFPTSKKIAHPSDFPKPKKVPAIPNLPEPEKIPARKETDRSRKDNLLKPKKLATIKHSSELQSSHVIPSRKPLIFPRPRKFPKHQFPLDFPNPENVTLEQSDMNGSPLNSRSSTKPSSINHQPVFPRTDGLPPKLISAEFPRPKIIHANEFPLDFPEPNRISPVDMQTDSADEASNHATSSNFPKPKDITVRNHTSKSSKQEKISKNLPILTFPRPGNFSKGPLFLTFIEPGKFMTAPRWTGFPIPQTQLETKSSNDSPTIALPSDDSKNPRISTDSNSDVDSPLISKPIFRNFPLPSSLPPGTTVTYKKVRKYKKKTHRKIKSNVHSRKESSQKLNFDEIPKKSPWKIKMIPKVLQKLPQKPSTGAPLIALRQEPVGNQPPPIIAVDSSFVVAQTESINEPTVSLKSEFKEADALPETTTVWAYVTAPGERTAPPEVLAAQAAEDSLSTFVDKPVVVKVLPPGEENVVDSLKAAEQQDNTLDEEVLSTTEHYVVAPEEFQPHDEPSAEYSPDIPRNVGEKVAYSSNGKRSDLPVASVEDSQLSSKHLIKKTKDVSETTSSTEHTSVPLTEQRAWKAYQMDCATEYDEKGAICKDWATAGLCTVNRPTMFLFCRKTCLCVGPAE